MLATVRPVVQRLRARRAQVTAEVFARLRAVLGMNGDEAIDVWERAADGGRQGRRGPPSGRCWWPRTSRARRWPPSRPASICPGVKIVSAPRRSYPTGTLAAHVLGYMNEISAEELRAKKDEGYRAGDLIGRTGIERQWDGYLRGHAGFQKVVVDRRGLPKTDIRDVIEGPDSAGGGPRQQRRADPRRRPAAHRRAGAAQRARRRARWCWTSTPGGSWRWPRSRASIPTRCRAT